jgi:hypothetical protein
MFGIEQLEIESKDSGNGKRFNRLVNNQWNRTKLYENLKKRCNLIGIKFIEVIPNYSSFVGNIIYRKEKYPDMILSSIEIGRRTYEFNLQYLLIFSNNIDSFFISILRLWGDYRKCLQTDAL